ncbi:hypothetical protein cyc_04694 [Cyclospora cayetanensis]|uniref:Uncharacterized protein n=1 Tax=Cyclospora cayetanensis TaxID=88456 RepID=A0A1D3CYG0_9EIME|nr:hypothetical protein cyc_04694 [Cyclospora cayetanensis]
MRCLTLVSMGALEDARLHEDAPHVQLQQHEEADSSDVIAPDQIGRYERRGREATASAAAARLSSTFNCPGKTSEAGIPEALMHRSGTG